jgi:mRNA interferase MazF
MVLITTNLSRLGHPSRVSIAIDTPEGRSTGLLSDSVVMADNLATVRHEAVEQKIGLLRDLAAVDAAVRYTLGL